jgi:hypothetical protein
VRGTTVNQALENYKLARLRQGFVDKALAAAVVGSTDLPIAARDLEWDGAGAARRVFDAYTDDDGNVDTEAVGRAFLYRDPDADPTTQGAYKLGFADIVDGELRIVPRGVAATAGGRGVRAADVPADEVGRIESRICSLYDEIRDMDETWPACPFGENSDDDSEDD